VPAASAPAQAAAPKPNAAVAAAPAPTQPPTKSAPLRLRFKASFDAGDALAPAGLADLKKLAPRVKQYASEQVTIIGPVDSSGLKGKYASNEARSQARAMTVALSLGKLAGIPAEKVKAQPYSPPSAAAGAPNSIQIYVELK
jgi:outer membrane protein OmpA-like peptidoglycan-associated protein